MNKFPYMHPREIILVLALFVLLALVLGNGMEIISCPSPDDDAFYVRKSLSLLGSWSDSATLKEIGSPLFFRLVRTACIPLRIAFGVGYALALFLAWLELRRWRFPAWLSLVATLVPLFMPAQYSVFSRATADPLSVILSLCLFVACLAVYRRNGCWLSTTGAGIVAAMIWLNRPEGTLGILPVIFTLALLRFKKEGDVPPPGFRKITTRIAAVIAILLATMLCIDTVNRVHYGFFAPTIMKAAPLDRTLKRLSSIDDGEPPVPGRPVSKRAMELAFKNSPSMALARQYWSDNTDGKGWSSSNFRDYSPADGSVDGGHFHFAFRYSAAAVAGSNTRAQLRYFQQTAGELESAMRRGALPRRSVPGNALGPSFNIASPGLWKSVWETSRLMLGGGGDILKPSDTADTEQNLMFDFACSRRGGLLPAGTDYVQIRGWMALGDKSGIIDQIFPETMPGESTFHIVNRPDVPQALYGRRIDPANCGFELTVPAGDAAKMILLVSANGHKERFPALELMGMKDTEIIRGNVRAHVDEVRQVATPLFSPAQNATMMNWLGTGFSGFMADLGILAIFLLSACICFSRQRKNQIATWNAMLAITFVAASIVLPRLFLLAAIAANRFPTGESRLQMPGSVVVWLWEILVIGFAITLFTRQQEEIIPPGEKNA